MVIGNGLIAKRFASFCDDERFLVFASGVSNSFDAPTTAFEREKKLLSDTLKTNQAKLLVYFSTCSINDKSMLESAYVQHKINVEKYIIANHNPYLIFRLTNPVGNSSNTHTVVNYFIKNITERHPFEVWQHATRNIIDIDDMYLICNEIIRQNLFTNSIISIANPESYSVPFIVETIEKHFGIKGNYTLAAKGDGPVIDISAIRPLFRKFNINFDQHYLSKVLQKYFPR